MHMKNRQSELKIFLNSKSINHKIGPFVPKETTPPKVYIPEHLKK